MSGGSSGSKSIDYIDWGGGGWGGPALSEGLAYEPCWAEKALSIQRSWGERELGVLVELFCSRPT